MKPASYSASQLLFASGALAGFMRGTGLVGAGMQVGTLDESLMAQMRKAATNETHGYGTFDQLIDHNNPSLGTFKQRIWWGTDFWKGPGSPVYLVNPGEQPADKFNTTYFSNQRLTGLMAQKSGGAVVILEHRYWGDSSPYDELTVENLQYLTLENSIKDNTYFANNWKAPFDDSGKSSAKDAPWVFTGGSYPGALAGWIAAKDPGTFHAYYGSSGVVEAIADLWTYFVPVQEGTAKNCSSDIDRVVTYVDKTLSHGSKKDKKALKDMFMLGDLQDADFAQAIEYGPWQWQSGQFYSDQNGGNPYYEFCDYVENVWPGSKSKVPGKDGVGLKKALSGYAKWFKEINLPGNCESFGYFQGVNNTDCFKAQNPDNPIYKDLTPRNAGNRQWNWMLCNEPFEYWQNGAPKNQKTLVSRLINNKYWQDQCPLWFPGLKTGIPAGKTAEDVNLYTGGWLETNVTRVMYTNGEWDPWRESTMSAKVRPGGPLKSTKELPVRVLKHGTHCSDLYGKNWAVNADAKKVADDASDNMAEWVKEFDKPKYGHN